MSSNPVFDYFIYDEETNGSHCEIGGCIFPTLKGKKSSNLNQHIKKRHAEAFAELNIKKNNNLALNKNHAKKARTNDTVVNVNISRKEFVSGCLKFVVLDGRPFNIFRDIGFQQIVSPILREFDRINEHIPLGLHYIQRIAKNVQIYIVNQIKSEMMGKLVSLQLDLTNHFQRCILGISVQYYVGNELVLRVLAMRRLQESTSALNLATEIRRILGEYDVDVDNIYTVTTDNGANVLLCTQILQIMQEKRLDFFLLNCDGSDINDEALNALIEIESERILQNQSMHFVHIIHCGAHTFQLGIGDALKTFPAEDVVKTCRDVVKKLRTPTIVNLLKLRQSNLAKIDIDIRWSSIHDMVSVSCFVEYPVAHINYRDFLQLDRLNDLKPFCLEMASLNKDFHMDEDIWSKMNDIIRVLKVLKDATVQLQKQNLTMTDSFGIWLEARARLEVIPHCPLSTIVLQKMDVRQETVFKNDVMYAAMFLDPRFQIMLTEDQISTAKKHLTYLHQKQIQKLNAIQQEIVTSAVERRENDNENLLEKYMQKIESNKKMVTHSKKEPIRDPSLQIELVQFEAIERSAATVKIMDFWFQNRFNFPILYQLSRTIFAVPPTEVSIERHFSTLTFILNKYRNRLTDENLETVLFLKLNESIFHQSIETTDVLLTS